MEHPLDRYIYEEIKLITFEFRSAIEVQLLGARVVVVGKKYFKFIYQKTNLLINYQVTQIKVYDRV